MADYENLIIDRIGTDGRVGRITLNRPEKMNALSQELLFELNDALHDMEADHSIRVLILRGAGRTFSAGYDLTPSQGKGADGVVRSFKPTDEKGRRLMMSIRSGMQQITDIHMYFWNMAKITIAQVHGYCVAGGTDLALHCDMIVVAEDAKIGFTPVRAMGTPPTHMWIYSVGPQWAKRMLLTGDLISGSKAADIGWAIEAVPNDALDDTALGLATRMSHIGKDLLTANKYIVNKAMELMGRTLLQQIALEHDAIAHLAPEALEFGRMSQEEGLKAALSWRDGPFEK